MKLFKQKTKPINEPYQPFIPQYRNARSMTDFTFHIEQTSDGTIICGKEAAEGTYAESSETIIHYLKQYNPKKLLWKHCIQCSTVVTGKTEQELIALIPTKNATHFLP